MLKRFHSLPGTSEYSGMSRSTVLRRVKDGTFPAPVRLGPGRVAWDVRDLEAWAADRPRAVPQGDEPESGGEEPNASGIPSEPEPGE